MKSLRRMFAPVSFSASTFRPLALWSVAIAFCIVAAPLCMAQDYPQRPIKMIVPYPAGGVLDTITRAISEQARESLGQAIIVENRVGANGSIGLQACAMAAPDGYTFCAVTAEAMSTTPHLEPKLYERYSSLIGVTQLVTAPGVVYANPSLAAGNLNDVVAIARARPTELSYSSWGIGSSSHLFYEWLKKKNNVEILHIPTKGSIDALNEVLSGRVPLSYVAVGLVLPQFEAGKLKPLAVLGDERLPQLRDTPSLKELGIEFPYKNAWFGVLAPAGTPQPVLDKVAAAVNTAVNNPALRAKFLDPQAYTPVGSSPSAFAQVLKAEYNSGAEIIRITGVKVE